MCGIVGVGAFSTIALTMKGRDFFQNALVADSARGVDGTGMMKIHTSGSVSYAKIGGDPYTFFRSEGFQKTFWEGMTSKEYIRWLVGHNRWATTGKPNTKNAHPFRYEHIWLVHNGTLRGGTKFKEIKEFEVDSEALTAAIAKHGLEETLAKTEGAYALAFFNSKEKTFNLIRNYERPMAVCYDPGTKGVFFASEIAMLPWILERNKLLCEKLHEIPVHTLYSWKLENEDGSLCDEYKPKITEVKTQYTSYSNAVFVDAEYWSRSDGANSVQQSEKKSYDPPTKFQYFGVEASFKKKDKKNFTGFPHSAQDSLVPLPKIDNEKTTDYLIAETIGTLKNGSVIDIRYTNYDEMKCKVKEHMNCIVYGKSQLYPNVDFRLRFTGPDMDFWELISGNFIRGRIVSLLVPSAQGFKKGIEDNVVWLYQSKAVFDKDKEKEYELEDDAYRNYLKRKAGTNTIVLPTGED